MEKRVEQALVVEDVASTSAWLAELLRAVFPGCRVQLAASVHQGRCAIEDAGPYDLALIDLGLPDGSGIALLQLLAEQRPECLRIVSTIFADDGHLFPALQAGAQGYILKDEPAARVRRALEGIVAGEPPLSAAIAQRVLAAFTVAPSDRVDEAALAPREREALLLIAKGYRLPEVAHHLGITRNTAAGYLKAVYRKLGVSSRAEATLAAARMGLVGSGSARQV